MNHSAPNLDSRDTSLQPIIYAYPPSAASTDEIDLGEILSKLIEHWKLLAAIVIGGSFISIIIALTSPRVYQVNTTLSLPSMGDVSPFETNGLNVGSANEVFKRYYNMVRSQDQFADFLKNNGYLLKLFPDSVEPEDKQLGRFLKNFSSTIDEPLPTVKGGLVDKPERITLTITHSNETLIAELLSFYVKYTGDTLIERVTQEQSALVSGQIRQLEAKINVLRISANETRQAEIFRLTEENSESRIVAENLGIIYPADVKKIESNSQEKNSSALTKVNNKSIPLFLVGTRYLDSLINSINDKKNEEGFVGELNDLRKQLAIVTNDAKLAALNARVSDDPYIPEMPAIKSKIAGLKALSLDFSKAKPYTLENAPLVTETPVKPNRKLIVILGGVLSGIFALFVGLIVIVLRKPIERN